MQVRLSINKARFEALKDHCSDLEFTNIVEEKGTFSDDDYIAFELNLRDSLDVLSVFHAGIKFGLNQGLNIRL